MDNSAYVPNQLPPPLVVFSQAGGFSEAALRMQRPFNPQIGETKELQSPFSQAAASLDYRLHQHMLHLQHQFLHPLEHRLPFGSAFRPLAPSAFAPPQKRLKLEPEGGPSPGGLSSLGSLTSMSSMFSPVSSVASSQPADLAPQSPANSTSSRSPPGQQQSQPQQLVAPPAGSDGRASASAGPTDLRTEEEREASSATPCSENTERSTPEDSRAYRMGNVFGGRCGAEALGLGLMSLNPAYRFALPPGLAAKTTRCLALDQGKKKFSADPTSCPVCGASVRPQELEQHFLQELDRLFKLSSASPRPRPPRAGLPPATPEHLHNQLLHTPSAADGTPIGRWETFKRIKANRQARLRIKNRKRKADEPACPVCGERLSGTPEELNQHVERCLSRQNGPGTGGADRHQGLDDEEVDVEGDTESFEEYEWAGQRRVRPTPMLLQGYSGAGLAAVVAASSVPSDSSHQQDDEDMDLVVDGDESAQYGPAQYTEADVVTPRHEGSAREQKEREALREAVISPNGQQARPQMVEVKTEPSSSPGSHHQPEESATAAPGASSSTSPHLLDAKNEQTADAPVVEALRCRVRELEAEMRGQGLKCLICMEPYKKPVTSVCCWHVHCESCWLHTLGAKKLCPQCNMITSPSDLRRIYL
ncbi:E3 ubiquitin-protein ligase Rnf220-like [Copidosoma floridanum]|uniref:E3 ubiquitin-protein ligase Rnf220-like n=1 Tax=Copidosoma floridanum TaxID=29053 RepID=UPI000C6FB511|nr:E3 ubiquitin-protein ligase Rnf220-like [Copidosoma floridanum]